jgi:ribosomal protein S18 acetylase RimI-like enzyme
MFVRLATPSDAAALLRLNDAFNGPGSDIAHIEHSLRENPNEIVCVAELDSEAVGFCCAQLVSSICYKERSGEITELYVEPRARRKGLATGLMRLAERELISRGATGLKLLTGDDNFPARALYESLGYELDGEVHYAKDAE